MNSFVSNSIRNLYNGEAPGDLYGLVCSDELLDIAYDNLSSRSGIVAAGIDHMSLDMMNIERLDSLTRRLRKDAYFPSPSQRLYIAKKKGGQRPLGLPCTDDKLVQEEVRIILDAVYDSSFDEHSHAFRTGRGTHTAIADIKDNFDGVNWFIEGDIKSFFDNISHDVLLGILGRKIHDTKFLGLIEAFLKSGYIDRGRYIESKIGTPQGGIVSPILANIYLDVLDRYVRTINESTGIAVKYVRYADDFLIGVRGSQQDCETIKANLSAFLNRELKLELSQEKTLVSEADKGAVFLGYEVKVTSSTGKVELLVPEDVVRERLLREDVIGEDLKPQSNLKLVSCDDKAILRSYRNCFSAIRSHFVQASNLQEIADIMKGSLLLTLREKYRADPSLLEAQKTLLLEEIQRAFVVANGYDQKYTKYRSPFICTHVMADRLRKGVCEICGETDLLIMRQVQSRKMLSERNPKHKKILDSWNMSIAVCPHCNYSLQI